MKKISILIITLTMLLVFATTAWGISFGARAAGMGGAFTAVADDCSAVYWNPAGITQLKFLTLTPGVGLQGSAEEILEFLDLMEDPTYPPTLPDSLSLGVSGYAGVTTKLFGVNVFLDSNILLYQEAPLNKMYTEMNAYGIGTIALPLGPIAIGGNLKLVSSSYSRMVMPDAAYLDPAVIAGNPDYIDFILDNSEITTASGEGVAIDAGVLLSFTKFLKIGIAARNLISNVDWSGSTTKYKFDPVSQTIVPTDDSPQEFFYNGPLPTTFAVGIALRPFSSTLIAADVEMITNPIDPDFNLIIYHVGFEQQFLFKLIALRVGASGTSLEEIGFSAGVGVKLGPLLLDAAVTLAEEAPGVYVTAGFKF